MTLHSQLPDPHAALCLHLLYNEACPGNLYLEVRNEHLSPKDDQRKKYRRLLRREIRRETIRSGDCYSPGAVVIRAVARVAEWLVARELRGFVLVGLAQ